jgi:hypothetical protein
MRLASAANLLTPAYLTVIDRGYAVGKDGDMLTATKGDDTFIAEDPISLLGIIAVAEARGENWQATDEQIDEFLARFG